MSSANVLSAFDLDRAATLRSDPLRLQSLREGPRARFLVMSDLRHLVEESASGGSRPALLSASEAVALGLEVRGSLFLGLADRLAFFAVRLSRAEATAQRAPFEPSGSWQDLRQVASRVSPRDAQLLAYSRGLTFWHQRHGFCAECGSETVEDQGGHLRKCSDDGCGRHHFPRTDPAVIVLISHGDQVLLGRQASWPKGVYSALAGFVEPGESLEAAARREIFEEVGVVLESLEYASSQPWPFPASLMVGFNARAQDLRLDVDHEEIEDALWIERSELLERLAAREMFVPPRLSIARRLIDSWLQRDEG